MEEDINILLLYNRKRYTDDGKKALQIVNCIADRFESINLGPVYFADRDALPGTDIFDELARVINRAKVIICVMTKGFTGSEWNLWTSKIALKHNLDRQDDEENTDQLGQVSKQTFMLVRYRVPDDVFKKKCQVFQMQALIPEVPDDVLTGGTSDAVDRFWNQVIRGAMANQRRREVQSGSSNIRPVEEGNAQLVYNRQQPCLAQQQRRNPAGANTVNRSHAGRNEPLSFDGASGDGNTAVGELAEQFSRSVSLRPDEPHGSSFSVPMEDGPRATPETRQQHISPSQAAAAAAETREAKSRGACRSPAAPLPGMQQQQTAATGAEAPGRGQHVSQMKPNRLSTSSTAGTTSGCSVEGATTEHPDPAEVNSGEVDGPLSSYIQAQSPDSEDYVLTTPPIGLTK